MLRTKGDECLYLWAVSATLSVASEELTTLGKADGVKAVVERWQVGELLADVVDLSVDGAEKGGRAVG